MRIIGFIADAKLWRETDGAINWAREVFGRHKLMPPEYARPVVRIIASAISTENNDSNPENLHSMFLGMYFTAIDMASDYYISNS
jgi:hypothetical protein